MPYVLGVDVGSSRIAAMLCRRAGESWAESEPVELDAGSSTCPATLYLDDAEYLLLGPDAEEPATARPTRAAHAIMTRVGDRHPMVLGGQTWAAEDLAAGAISSVVRRVGADEDEPPERVAVTHPAWWGTHRRDALAGALRRQDVGRLALVPETAALAENHAALESVPEETTVGTCSLGARHCTAALLRKDARGVFAPVGAACTAEGVGGGRFDDLLLDYVATRAGAPLDDLDPDEPAHRDAIRRLRTDCENAKIALSTRAAVELPVTVAGQSSTVRIERDELDRLLEPVVAAAADTVERAVRYGSQPPATAVLAGGSAAVPLVASAVSARLACRVVVAPRPELAAARGACVVARLGAGTPRTPPPSERHTTVIERQPPAAVQFPEPRTAASAGERPPPPPIELEPLELPDRRLVTRITSTVRPGVLSALVVALVAAGVVLTFVLHGDGGGANPRGRLTGKATTTSAPASSATPPSGQSEPEGGAR